MIEIIHTISIIVFVYTLYKLLFIPEIDYVETSLELGLHTLLILILINLY
jgi:hypothetical protein